MFKSFVKKGKKSISALIALVMLAGSLCTAYPCLAAAQTDTQTEKTYYEFSSDTNIVVTKDDDGAFYTDEQLKIYSAGEYENDKKEAPYGKDGASIGTREGRYIVNPRGSTTVILFGDEIANYAGNLKITFELGCHKAYQNGELYYSTKSGSNTSDVLVQTLSSNESLWRTYTIESVNPNSVIKTDATYTYTSNNEEKTVDVFTAEEKIKYNGKKGIVIGYPTYHSTSSSYKTNYFYIRNLKIEKQDSYEFSSNTAVNIHTDTDGAFYTDEQLKIYGKYDADKKTTYGQNAAQSGTREGRYILNPRGSKTVIVFGDEIKNHTGNLKITFELGCHKAYQTGTLYYSTKDGAVKTELQPNAEMWRSYTIESVSPNSKLTACTLLTEEEKAKYSDKSGLVVSYPGNVASDFFCIRNLKIEKVDKEMFYEKRDSEGNLEYKILETYNNPKGDWYYDSVNQRFVIRRMGRFFVNFGEKYTNSENPVTIKFTFATSKALQNGRIYFASKTADGFVKNNEETVGGGNSSTTEKTYEYKNVLANAKNLFDGKNYLEKSGFEVYYNVTSDDGEVFYIKDIEIIQQDGVVDDSTKFAPYSIEAIEFADGALSPEANGKITGVSLRRACISEPTSKTLVVASYNSDGSVLNTALTKNISAIGHGKAAVVPIELALDEKTASVKAFLFDSIEGIVPLAKSLTVNKNTNEKPTIYIAGDSTAATNGDSSYPRAGWGQMLGKYFNEENVTVDNRAKDGRSSRSFIEKGDLDSILTDIKPGDYLFIQFAHNDSKTDVNDGNRYTVPDLTYDQYLTDYIKAAREKGAYPVLITSLQRRWYKDNGTFYGDEGLAEYYTAMRSVASQYAVPLVDLAEVWGAHMLTLDNTTSKNYYLYVDKDETDTRFDSKAAANYPEGVADATHFNIYGADFAANKIVDLIEKIKLPVAQYRNDYKAAEVPAHYKN